MRLTYEPLCVRSNAYAPSTTFCIHVPMFDANVPNHTMRKSRCRSAAPAVPRVYGTSPSTSASSTSSSSYSPRGCATSAAHVRHSAGHVFRLEARELVVVDLEQLAQHLVGVLAERGRGP